MSKDDGIPSWLEPVKPDHVNEDVESAHTSSNFQPGVRRSHNINTKHKDAGAGPGSRMPGAYAGSDKEITVYELDDARSSLASTLQSMPRIRSRGAGG
ncbi:hypothetical protein TrVFT333_011143 [Trichoderma virens FT-333]|nr:hypothetical protein TrVFT333_011143 [Trichoderma virens FT-333]